MRKLFISVTVLLMVMSVSGVCGVTYPGTKKANDGLQTRPINLIRLISADGSDTAFFTWDTAAGFIDMLNIDFDTTTGSMPPKLAGYIGARAGGSDSATVVGWVDGWIPDSAATYGWMDGYLNALMPYGGGTFTGDVTWNKSSDIKYDDSLILADNTGESSYNYILLVKDTMKFIWGTLATGDRETINICGEEIIGISGIYNDTARIKGVFLWEGLPIQSSYLADVFYDTATVNDSIEDRIFNDGAYAVPDTLPSSHSWWMYNSVSGKVEWEWPSIYQITDTNVYIKVEGNPLEDYEFVFTASHKGFANDGWYVTSSGWTGIIDPDTVGLGPFVKFLGADTLLDFVIRNDSIVGSGSTHIVGVGLFEGDSAIIDTIWKGVKLDDSVIVTKHYVDNVAGGTSDSIGYGDAVGTGVDGFLYPLYLFEGENVSFTVTGNDSLSVGLPGYIELDSIGAEIIKGTGTGNGRLILNGATSGSGGFTVDSTAGNPTIMTLPTSDPTPGYQWTWNAGGIITWEPAGGAGGTSDSIGYAADAVGTGVDGFLFPAYFFEADGITFTVTGGDSLSIGVDTNGTALRALVLGHLTDSLDEYALTSAVELLIEDSLDEYSTTSAIASAYQPLEATLTDIADGTIAENLVNTANPWADNEVTSDLTITTSTVITANDGIIVKNGAETGGFVQFYEDSDEGTDAIALTAPALAANITLTLPATDGDANDVLISDGSGALSFHGLDSAIIADGDLSQDDIAWKTEWLELTAVYGWSRALADSITAYENHWDGARAWKVLDVAGDITAGDRDTLVLAVTIPYSCVIDSFVVNSFATGDSGIVAYQVLGPDLSDGDEIMLDSSYQSAGVAWGTGTKANPLVSRVDIASDISASAGQKYGLLVITDFRADNDSTGYSAKIRITR